MLDKVLPAGTKLSLVYNQAENFKADAPRGDVFGHPIANPEAKTKEYGVALSTLHDRLNLRLTHFETKQKNATLTGATGGGFGGNFYLFWACPYWSATEAVRLKRGSTTTSFALRVFFASTTHLKPQGCASAGLPPMTKTTSAFLMSTQWLVIAPRPKLGARLATVGACQIRACVSSAVMPSARSVLTVR